MLETPAYRQYRGTETDEIVRKPGPVNRGLNKTDGDGATEGGIMAQDPEERRVDSDTMRKVAQACLETIKLAITMPGVNPSLDLRMAKVRPPSAKPSMLTQAKNVVTGANRNLAKSVFSRHDPDLGPGRSFTTQSGDRFRFDPKSGTSMIQENGRWRMPNTGSDTDRMVLQNRLGGMTHLDRHRMLTGIRDATGKPVRGDTFGNRLIARGADAMAHPLAPMIAPMAAHAAMRFIPAGRDEYGHRRSLADTTFGQIGAALTPLAVPYLAQRSGLGQLGSRMMGSHIIHTPPPSPHIGG